MQLHHEKECPAYPVVCEKCNKDGIPRSKVRGRNYGSRFLTFGKFTLVPGGGGVTLLHKPCRYVQPQRLGVLHRFGLKTGIDFAHFGLELGMIFEETTRASVWSYLSFQFPSE